jgi:hypothetical protein
MDHAVGTTRVYFDEKLVTLLLAHLTADTREGWAGWGRLCFVNRACVIVFRENMSQLVEYRLRHMYFLVDQKNRQLHERDRLLWHWMKNCECRGVLEVFHDGSDSETDRAD